jgi:HlyD family secretion protein
MSRPSKKLIFVVAGIVIVLLAGWWALGRWWGGGRNRAIRLSGNIELTQVDISFKIPGKLIERAVDEGQAVKKGMVLGRLDDAQLLEQRERERAGVAGAEAALRQVLTAVEFQKASLEAETDLRRAEVRAAEARLRDLLAGARRQEIEQARAALDEARTEEQRATADWDRAQRLYKNDDISRAQYDQFQARHQAAAAMSRQAGERLALVQEGPRREEIEAGRAQLERARAALRLSQAAALELKRREQEVDSRRADLQRARAQLAVTQTQLDDSIAVAPIDGVVLSKAAEPGQVVAAGTAILTLGDLEHPWLRAYINETDLGRVKLGARVRVTTDSFPGKVYWGGVSFIASDAEFTPKQIQTAEERVKLVYRVKIELPNPNHELKSNMPADAEILLEK